MSLRLLCIGDIHLGRRPSRLPEDLAGEGLSPAELGPAAAFQASVERAVAEGVDAVLLAGDVVESDAARFEAFAMLERGLRRLAAAGIRTIAVAGNHDVVALPRLADLLPDDLVLLGRGGRWQQQVLEKDGRPALRLLGWSFPQRVVRESPLASLGPVEGDGPPLLGLLHCELGASGGPYAPVQPAELEAVPVRAWLLGHVHVPHDLAAMERPIGYLGSLVGLDPGEHGPRGPWLLTVEGARASMRQLPLAPLRWERQELDVAQLEPGATLESALQRAVRELHERIAPGLGEARAVGCRITLTGRRPPGLRLSGEADEADGARALRFEHGGVLYFLETVRELSRPALELASLAAGRDPAGLLARDLLALEQGGDGAAALLLEARRALDEEAGRSVFRGLESAKADDAALTGRLLASGWRALEELLAQVEPQR